MAKQRAHHVHLRMGGTGVATALVDLLQNGGGFSKPVPQPAIARWNKCGQPAGVCQRLDERLGIDSSLVEIAPIRIREAHAERTHFTSQSQNPRWIRKRID